MMRGRKRQRKKIINQMFGGYTKGSDCVLDLVVIRVIKSFKNIKKLKGIEPLNR